MHNWLTQQANKDHQQEFTCIDCIYSVPTSYPGADSGLGCCVDPPSQLDKKHDTYGITHKNSGRSFPAVHPAHPMCSKGVKDCNFNETASDQLAATINRKRKLTRK